MNKKTYYLDRCQQPVESVLEIPRHPKATLWAKNLCKDPQGLNKASVTFVGPRLVVLGKNNPMKEAKKIKKYLLPDYQKLSLFAVQAYSRDHMESQFLPFLPSFQEEG